MKKIIMLISIFTLTFTSASFFNVIGSSTVHAEKVISQDVVVEDVSNLSETEAVEELIKVLDEENVSQEKIDILVQKFKKGEKFDSDREEYKNLKPQVIKPGYQKTIYPDGSYFIEQTEDLTVPKAITTKKSVLVKKTTVFISAEFYMDYQIDTTTKKVKITNQYNTSLKTRLGSFSDMERGYWNDWRNPSHAWLSFVFTASNNGASEYCWLKGYANTSTTWTEHNWGIF